MEAKAATKGNIIKEGDTIPAEFIVKVSKNPQKVVVEFATMNDLLFVEKWRETLGVSPEPIQRDVVDLAQLARDRYIADSKVGQPYIAAAEDVHEHLAGDQQCEVGGFILLKCEWFPDSKTIGFCHFRRTWCNNIVLDYLGKHPRTLGHTEDPRYKIGGIGPALLCYLSRIAVKYSCGRIWGEATQTSRTFYERQFALEKVKDLFVIERDNFNACAELKLDWQSKQNANTINMEAAQELYDVEEKHPPLVGNRTLTMSSRRQLIEHFLDLPRHVQDETAQSLGLLREGDGSILEDEWCRLLFQRAAQSGKLHELWDSVEKQHEDGDPQNNPFTR